MVRFVGDRVRFTVHGRFVEGCRAMLRTTLGRGERLRSEIVQAIGAGEAFAGAAWRDIPMPLVDGTWALELSLPEAGFFRAKAYIVDSHGRQHWPAGSDVGLCIHPNSLRSANSIYCAFARAYGPSKSAISTRIPPLDDQFAALDKHGFTVIPPSGKLRDLAAAVPHIVERLGCRIVHLLPINPTPTTYARFGRFGSPYAATDFTAIDPALVEFDKRTTAVEQFSELADAVHLRGARLFLDLAINHTGWGSWLIDNHPEWFRRNSDGSFHSPGAWGNTWEDLVELDHRFPALFDHLADAVLTWCRRGVDGFRCDAGYMLPTAAWQYVTARVHQEFPSTCFLLEGLGGGWDDTERLLTDGGMQWAYSELFQNYDGPTVSSYLDHAHRQSERVGTLIHYSETHDNQRLALGGRTWSLLRNRLCALTSVSGGFGFTGGVEWLATEKIEVHQSRSLNWGATTNIVPELARLNRLINDHPCFLDGAALTRLSPPQSPVYVLRRVSAEGTDTVLVLANLDPATTNTIDLPLDTFGATLVDLADDHLPTVERHGRHLTLTLAPGQVCCLADSPTPHGLAGEDYRRLRALAAFAIRALARAIPLEDIGPHDWRALATFVDHDAARFLAAVGRLDPAAARSDLLAALTTAAAGDDLPRVTRWTTADLTRVLPVPPGHWLLLHDAAPFAAVLSTPGGGLRHVRSLAIAGGHIAAFPSGAMGDSTLTIERFTAGITPATATVRWLAATPRLIPVRPADGLALLTNGRGAMARLHADLGKIASKYDCLLGANLHANVPCDRHILAKRLRAWVNADGFITALDRRNLVLFEAGPPARWRFLANAGDGRTVLIELVIDLIEGRNTVAIRVERPAGDPPAGVALPADRRVSVTLRIDLEDRSFHAETARSDGASHHFTSNTTSDRHGFRFAPAADRTLSVVADAGTFHAESEWSHVDHPIDAERGQVPGGDAWSPGWFELPLTSGTSVRIAVSAEAEAPHPDALQGFADARVQRLKQLEQRARSLPNSLDALLVRACDAFVVRRNTLKTIIAGYPWFLDWGRDSLICARGLIAAGLHDEVRDLLLAFAALEKDGTLPNAIHGDDHANRDTSDAPLWFGVVCEELAAVLGHDLYAVKVDDHRTLADVLASIANGYLHGTPNGIAVDHASGLVFSPPHFTWMDTNHPACTPREGYPVEIQALWIRLLRHLESARIPAPQQPWWTIADRATASLKNLYWLDQQGWLADNLIAPRGVPATQAVRDEALRSNGLIAVSFGLLPADRARRLVAASERHLVIPGALRSLAPLPVRPPLRIAGSDGQPLFNPDQPYHGHYRGDEDTRRKPAYHNGTAWTWTFPMFCEALVRAHDFAPAATAAARAYLGSIDRLLGEGCLGQLPEIIDGDAPHTQRGCDAQAWGACEALRVLRLLTKPGPEVRKSGSPEV
jgi:predicted glycogen debranching enzyme